MTAIAMVVAFFAVVVGWSYVQHKRSPRPLWNPLWLAFTLTALSLLYGIGGLLGYDVPRHNPFIDRAPVWVGHIVWPQVSWALAALLVSLFFWWLGLRRLAQS